MFIAIMSYVIISAIITHYWLGWNFPPLLLCSFLGLPLVIIVWFINKALKRKINFLGIDVEF